MCGDLDDVPEASMRQDTSSLEVYLPREALQGEALPSFAIWHHQTFKTIEVTFPEALQVDELYNVAPGDRESEPGKLTVRRVEIEGYLGILFGSKRLESTSERFRVVFQFHHHDGAAQSVNRDVHLFHPLLAVERVSEKIRVNLADRKVEEVIQVRNVGTGTVIVSVTGDKDSDVQICQPKAISEFIRSYREDVTTGLAELERVFSHQSSLLRRLGKFLGGGIPLGDQTAMEEFKNVAIDFRKAVADERNFDKAVMDTIAGAILKNLHLFNIFEQLVDYLHSIRAKKVILRNPLDVIRVDTVPVRLKVKLEYTDLTNSYYEPITVDSTIISNAQGDVPIYMLLGWSV